MGDDSTTEQLEIVLDKLIFDLKANFTRAQLMQREGRGNAILKAAYNLSHVVMSQKPENRTYFTARITDAWQREHSGWAAFVTPYFLHDQGSLQLGLECSRTFALLMPEPGNYQFSSKTLCVEMFEHGKRVYTLASHWTDASNS